MEEKTNYLSHHGVQGQRWGVRRYQNSNGTLTEAGKKKYGIKAARKYYKSEYGLKTKRYRAKTLDKYKRYDKRISNNDRKRHKLEAGLSKEQINRGRSAVAKARKTKWAIASVSGATVAAGAAAIIATGGMALPFEAVTASISGGIIGTSTALKGIRRTVRYARESRAYNKAEKRLKS